LKNGTIDLLPVKHGQVKIRKRYFNYLVIEQGQYTYLKKRTANDIWQNLFEFPVAETMEKSDLLKTLNGLQTFFSPETEIHIKKESPWQKQVLSHQHIFYRFIYLKLAGKINIASSLIKVNKKDIFNFAVPKPIEKELEQNNWF
jgi:A/G-specific adenine glycosylase